MLCICSWAVIDSCSQLYPLHLVRCEKFAVAVVSFDGVGIYTEVVSVFMGIVMQLQL